MKNSYTIEDMMQLLNIKSRTTFWRKRRAGKIPPPDYDDTSPRWYKASIDKFMPNLIAD